MNSVLEEQLCKILIDIRKLDLAEKECNKIIKADSNNAIAYYNLACINAVRKDSENAISYLKQAIALDGQCIDRARNDRDFENVKFNRNFIKLLK